MALWIAAFFISMTWLFGVHLYVSPSPLAAALLTAAGLIVMAFALRRKVEFSNVHPLWAVLAVPALAAAFIFGMPAAIGLVLLAAGLFLLVLCRYYRTVSPVAAALLTGGVILTLQSLVVPLYFHYASARIHAPFLSAPVHAILSALGLRTSLSGGVIHIQTMRNNWPFPTTWAAMGLFPLLQLFVASAVMLPLFGGEPKQGRRALWAFIAGIAYLIVRYVFILLIFVYLMYLVDHGDDYVWITLFWNRGVTFASFIPLLLIFTKMFPLNATSPALASAFDAARAPSRSCRAGFFAAALAVAGSVFFTCYIGYWDAGRPKQGRILWDEKYSRWERTDRPFDTEWYGKESGYNYAVLVDLLRHYYKVDINDDNKLDRKLLQDYDILFLKNPTYPYSQEEITDMVEFVENGGGIFMMGEHTNVFGTSVPLNSVARNFGFFFRHDVVLDIENKFQQFVRLPALMRNPAVKDVNEFLFQVSCSIEPLSVMGPTRNAVVTGGGWTLPHLYASQNFYPPVEHRTDMTFGPLVQKITATRGRGRVVGFTDSTIFSNVVTDNPMCMPGKPEMILNSMEWLNRENGLRPNALFLWLSVICIAASVVLVTRRPMLAGSAVAGVCLAAFAAAVVASILTAHTARSYPMPEPHTPMVRIAFEIEYSDYEMPLTGFLKERERSYSTFYSSVQRLGYFPYLRHSFEEAIDEKPELLVIINPSRYMTDHRDFPTRSDELRFRQQFIPRLKEFLEAGGKVLLMDDTTNSRSISNEILREFDLRLESDRTATQPQRTTLLNPAGESVCHIFSGLHIIGGEPLMTTRHTDARGREEDRVILARKRIGSGTLLVFSASRRFANVMMIDSPGDVRNPQLVANWLRDHYPAFALQFAILRGIIEPREDSDEAALTADTPTDPLMSELIDLPAHLRSLGVQ